MAIINGTADNNTLIGTIDDDTINGLEGDDSLTGDLGNDTLDGGLGADTMAGNGGDDYFMVDDAGDVIIELADQGNDVVVSTLSYTLGDHLESLVLYGSANLNGTGNSLVNAMIGNSGGNVLDGGAGADILIGNHGNDTYLVDDTAEVVSEDVDEGEADLVLSSVTYALSDASYVELLTLTGAANINGTGNGLDNVITGNSGDNVLSGGGGADRLDGGGGVDSLNGGTGNDRYVVDSSTDRVTELASAGTDEVESSITWALGANLENLTLTGSGNINGTGNSLDNVLTGNSGNNVLKGYVGTDTMVGGLGNDSYYLDSVDDVVTELSGEGTDTVFAKSDFTLSANVENLTLLEGFPASNGTGNSGSNTLTGNSLANTLDGNGGQDTLAGKKGDDTYRVDSLDDKVTEVSGEGTDTIESSVSWTLGANVENLTLTGSGNLGGTGNTLNNVLTGNSGNNVLKGYGGVDTLIGGLGNDQYYLDSADDVVTELAGGGTDYVYAKSSYALSANIERLYLLDGYATALNGTGNAGANVLTGNTYGNVLRGNGGNDALYGQAGNDTYEFGRGDGQDTVTDTDATVGNTDVLSFLAGINHDQLWFSNVGNDLVVSVIGTTDKVTVRGWATGAANHVEQFRTTEGAENLLLSGNVAALVTAMSGFTPPPLGTTSLSSPAYDPVLTAIAAAWS